MRRAARVLSGVALLLAAVPVAQHAGTARAGAPRGRGGPVPSRAHARVTGAADLGAPVPRGVEAIGPPGQEGLGREDSTTLRPGVQQEEAPPAQALAVARAAREGVGDAALLPRALAGLPPFPGARPEPLAAEVLGPGVPFAAATFVTAAPPEEVLAYYRRALLAEGLPALELAVGGRAVAVGYVEPGAGGAVHLVTVVEEGAGARAFVSVAAVGEGLAPGVPVERR